MSILRTDYQPHYNLNVLADAVARSITRIEEGKGRESEKRYETAVLRETVKLLMALGANDPWTKAPMR